MAFYEIPKGSRECRQKGVVISRPSLLFREASHTGNEPMLISESARVCESVRGSRGQCFASDGLRWLGDKLLYMYWRLIGIVS